MLLSINIGCTTIWATYICGGHTLVKKEGDGRI